MHKINAGRIIKIKRIEFKKKITEKIKRRKKCQIREQQKIMKKQMHLKNKRHHTWSDMNYNYTETRHYAAFRSGYMNFENVPVDGAENIEDDLMESIEKFDFHDAVPFNPAYLAGFFTNRYDVGSEKAIQRAAERMSRSTISSLYSTVTGYQSVTQKNSSFKLRNTKIKYALYPVWILNTSWHGKKYMFAMNGQTGKFVGNLPMDKMKYWKYRLLYAIGIAAILYGGMLAMQLF